MILWINPVGGAAGDMLLAALVGAGADLSYVRDAVASTGLQGWQIELEPVSSGGITALAANIRIDDPATHRRAGELLALAGAAEPAPVRALAVSAVESLAAVEASIHNVPIEDVELHELGGHDTIVDIVGVAAALHVLEVDAISCAPLPLGTGVVASRHGSLPVPAPATLALLEGMVVRGCEIQAETVTPTAAALLRAAKVRFEPFPPMRIGATGYGAGHTQFPGRPNVLVAVLGTAVGRNAQGGSTQVMTVIETTVDDVSGEVLGHLAQALLDRGAADVWLTPVIGKKGRPAQVVSVLSTQQRADPLEQLLLEETGSLGVRRSQVERHALARWEEVVDIDGAAIHVKHGPHSSKPEHDDLVALAAARATSLRAATSLVARGTQARRHAADSE